MLLRSADDFLDENILRLGNDTDWASTRLNENRLWSRHAKMYKKINLLFPNVVARPADFEGKARY